MLLGYLFLSFFFFFAIFKNISPILAPQPLPPYHCAKYEPLPSKLNLKTYLVSQAHYQGFKTSLFIPQQWFPWQLLQHMTSPCSSA